jgi:hypothetical protein
LLVFSLPRVLFPKHFLSCRENSVPVPATSRLSGTLGASQIEIFLTMKKIKLYHLFGFTGITILLISCFIIQKVGFNISFTYYIFDSMQFGIASFLQYVLYTFAYFSIGKNSNQIVGILNLIFVTLPMLYFMFPEVISGNIDPITYMENPFFLDLEIYLPPILVLLFLIGQMLFLINLIIAVYKRRQMASA